MANNKLSLYVHLVWATWDRANVIVGGIEPRLHQCIAHEAQTLGCEVIALNGAENHVHVLLTIPTTVCIADIAKQLKGVSSRFVNAEFDLSAPFKWQGSYGAFTVGRWDIDKIAAYVKQQKSHHECGTAESELESSTEN